MRQSISIGPLTFYFYGFFVGLGIYLSYLISRKKLSKTTILPKDLDILFLFLLPVCLIGARLYHVVSWWFYYRMFPQEIFQIFQGGLGIYGAIIFGLAFTYLFSKIKKIDFVSLLDLLLPQVLFAQAVGRLGNYFNEEVFGLPTNLPWKYYVSPDHRPLRFLDQSYFHPTFFYESILCFIAFFLHIFLQRKYELKKGFATGYYLLSYGLIRTLTEFLRFDTWQIQGIKVAQVISLIFMITGAFIIKSGVIGKKLIK